MSNLLWKKKKEKRNENQNKNKKLQDNENGEKEKKTKRKKRRKRNLNIVEHSIWRKKKKERTDIFSKIDSTSLHRLKKEEKKTEHFWTVIVTLFWLVVKWKIFLSLFEFKGDIRNFFFLFILWNLTKTINRGFYIRFTNICNYIDSKIFVLEFGVFVE